MKVGIYGGSFNPVHLGHFEIVHEILKRQLVDKIIIVPAYQNPLKEAVPILPEHLRWQMLEKTFAEFDRVEISDFEIKKKELSYTHKTLRHFQSTLPKSQLRLILGEDAYHLFPRWSNPEQILALAKIIVFPRPDHREAGENDRITDDENRIISVNCSIPHISATEIRKASIQQLKQKPMLHRAALSIWEIYRLENY